MNNEMMALDVMGGHLKVKGRTDIKVGEFFRDIGKYP